METKLINGHNQFVFSEEDKIKIYDLFVNKGYSQRALMREFGCTQKPMSRVLDEMDLDHSRGNLTSFNYNYPEDIYDQKLEESIKEQIENISYSFHNNKYSLNIYYFDNIRDPEVIYTIGFLYADGCNQTNSVTMSLEEQDGYILEQMNQNIENKNPIKFKDLSNKHDFGYTYKNQYSMILYSRRIASVLNILGVVPRKSLILEFPKWLHPSMYSHFIRGVFDGDGSVHQFIRQKTAPQYNLTITSTENFCKALVDICAKYLSIRGHIYDVSCHNGITKVFTLTGPNIVQKFMGWMYKDVTIFLQRKYNRYCEYFNINNSLSA